MRIVKGEPSEGACSIIHRLGKIRVSRVLLDEYMGSMESKNPVFEHMVPLEIVYDYLSNSMIYTCASILFDPIWPGAEVPFYDCIMSKQTVEVKQESVVKFERIKPFSQ